MTPLIASALFGCAAAALGWSMVSSRSKRPLLLGADAERRQELRKRDSAIRFAEAWYDALVDFNAKRRIPKAEEIQRQLDLVYPGVWTPAEFVAASQLQAIFVAMACVALGFVVDFVQAAAIFGLIMGVMYPQMKLNHLKKLADERKRQVRSRLPFVLDLTSLMMEAGALFTESIQTVVIESGKHPIAEELGRVLASLRQGLPRAAALKEFSTRLDDDDVEEVIFAVNTSEELGTPLDKTLRSMADRMRQRRVQELERRSEQAKVHITWPAMLVMVACLLIVAAPLMLSGGM